MNAKEAVMRYQFAERSKSELIVASRMLMALSDFKGAEKTGARRMFKIMAEAFCSDLQMAYNSTSADDFKYAVDLLDEAISLTETEDYDAALLKISQAVSSATTPAQEAWEFLSKNEFI